MENYTINKLNKLKKNEIKFYFYNISIYIDI